MWDAAKAVLGQNCSTNPLYEKKVSIQRSQLPTEESSKRKANQTQSSKREEIMKSRAEINEIQNRKKNQKYNEMKDFPFKNMNKIKNTLGRLIRSNKEQTQLANTGTDSVM